MVDLGRGLRRVARELLPPIVARQLRRGRAAPPGASFTGDYRNIAEAAAAASGSSGYEDEHAIRATTQTTQALRARAEKEPTRADARVVQNLAAFLAVLQDLPSGPIRVLDFGGGVGLYYHALAPFLSRGRSLEWTVCELPALARAGRALGGPPALTFVDTLESLAGRRFDVAFASGSLQYVEDPAAIWSAFATLSDRVILNRIPLLPTSTDRLTVQSVQRDHRSFSCPAWFFSDTLWIEKLRQAGFEVILRWAVPEDVALLDGTEVIYSGLAARRLGRDALR
jgi:putative methyltransferase (TIGR04325 family)